MDKSDEEDIYLIKDVDMLGKTRKQKQKLRNQIKLNYDSDSSDPEGSDEGDEVVNGKDEQEQENDNKNDDDDDMFASDDNEDVNTDNQRKKSKTSQFLDLSQFEGQEQLTTANDASDVDEEDFDHDYYNNIEEIDIDTKTNKRPPKIEPFNLQEEANEGHFDLDGNYIPHAGNTDEASDINDDLWLDDYKRKDILIAKKAQEDRERKQTDKILEKSINMDPIEVLLSGLIDVLEPDETPMELLARLNPRKKINKKKNGYTAMDNQNKELIQSITNLCSILINDKYLEDVYDLTREELMRKYQMETGEAYKVKRGIKREREEDEEVDYGEKIWQFRWVGDEEINGPYSNYEMNHWKETYFENNVEVRKVGDIDFKHVSYIEFT